MAWWLVYEAVEIHPKEALRPFSWCERVSAVTKGSAGGVSPCHSVCDPGLMSLDHFMKMLLQGVHGVAQSLCDCLFWGLNLLVAGNLPSIPVLNLPGFTSG